MSLSPLFLLSHCILLLLSLSTTEDLVEVVVVFIGILTLSLLFSGSNVVKVMVVVVVMVAEAKTYSFVSSKSTPCLMGLHTFLHLCKFRCTYLKPEIFSKS